MENQIKKMKYPALVTVSKLFRILGWINGVVTGLIAMGVIVMDSGIAFIMVFPILVIGALITLLNFAFSEGLKVLMDIEENTRK